MSPLPSPSVQAIYYEKCEQGHLIYDYAQDQAAQQLDILLACLRPSSFFNFRKFWPFQEPQNKTFQGLYLHGNVGRGKTMLMDLFFSLAPQPKQRWHFHPFMQHIHAQLKAFGAAHHSKATPITQVITQLTKETSLLCLDEMEVKDLGDAMIMGRLLEGLLKQKVFLVITSNRAPSELYREGLHRERFLPTIQLLQDSLKVYSLNAQQDYRTTFKTKTPHYFTPLVENSAEEFHQLFLTLSKNAPILPTELSTWGRKWNIAKTAAGIAWITFQELCQEAHSAADYSQLAGHFHTVFLDQLPSLNLSSVTRDDVRRFILLIDVLYDRKISLFIRADLPLSHLYQGKEWSMEFERTSSRLQEMQAW